MINEKNKHKGSDRAYIVQTEPDRVSIVAYQTKANLYENEQALGKSGSVIDRQITCKVKLYLFRRED